MLTPFQERFIDSLSGVQGFKHFIQVKPDESSADVIVQFRDVNLNLVSYHLGAANVLRFFVKPQPMPQKYSDTQILNWLQSMHNLHTAVEVLYVVDGYRVQLTWDGDAVHEFEAPTLREAYIKAMAYRYADRQFVCVETMG